MALAGWTIRAQTLGEGVRATTLCLCTHPLLLTKSMAEKIALIIIETPPLMLML